MHPGSASQLSCERWLVHGIAVPAHEPGVVAFHAHPDRDSHVTCETFVVHATDVPLHEPIVVASQVQPGITGQEVALRVAQVAAAGVPMQRGPVVNVRVDLGARMRAELQQIWALQSLLTLHVLAHVVLHTPSQQISPPIVLQSVDCAHFFGHGVVVGFTQSPETLRFGSRMATESQQTSLLSVLQSVDPVHDLGHFEGGRQIGSL